MMGSASPQRTNNRHCCLRSRTTTPMLVLLVLAAAAAGGAAAAAATPTPVWQDATALLATRLDDLLPRLTRADLLAQLGGPVVADITRPNLTLPGTSWGQECLSGVGHGANSSAFPQPVALGQTFDTELVRAVGSAIGDEARALYNDRSPGSALLCLSPVSGCVGSAAAAVCRGCACRAAANVRRGCTVRGLSCTAAAGSQPGARPSLGPIVRIVWRRPVRDQHKRSGLHRRPPVRGWCGKRDARVEPAALQEGRLDREASSGVQLRRVHRRARLSALPKVPHALQRDRGRG